MMNLDELNRRQREANFPAAEAVTIEGAGAAPGPDGEMRVKITLLDHTQSKRQVHMTVPQAMYLFAMLRQIQADLKAEVPTSPPA